MSRGLALVPAAALAAACASAPPPGPKDTRGSVAVVQLSALELRDDQVDRFEHCPPAGELGQEWLPPVPAWHPSAAPADGEAAAPAAPDAPPTGDLAAPPEPASLGTLTTAAVSASQRPFRHCYHVGLLYDPTEDGHVGVVLRVGPTGKVVQVETYGACDITPDAIVCMRDEAAHLKLPPPIGGSATVTIPAVFTSGIPRRTGPYDTYAAGAYVAVESMRPRLHACIAASRREGTGLTASAVMSVDVDAQGKGVHIAVDQWIGSHQLLGCAAEVMRDAPFPKPPQGAARVVVPVVFNPRPGTR